MTKFAVISTVTIALATLAAPAAAQSPLRPNILILFDTSTSMVNNDGPGSVDDAPEYFKDGSPLCGGEGDGNPGTGLDFTRRIFALKRALREALAQVGTDEANFGLMRFPQLESPNMDRGCPSGHYYVDSSTATTVGASTRTGCRMSTHSATMREQPFGDWFRQGLRQSIVVDVTKPFNPATGPVAADFDPPGANLQQIYKWLDLSEAASNGVITDPELRGPRPSGGDTAAALTPLGRSLYYARLYFDNFIKPKDPSGSCRKNIVILVTDGQESCDDGDQQFVAQQPLLLALGGVEVYVVTDRSVCASPSSCGLNDTLALNGDPKGQRKAIRVDLTDVSEVKRELIRIIAEAVPAGEECNGVDDNCNGDVDNMMGKDGPLPGIGSTCLCPGLSANQVGKGMCKAGAWVCRLGTKQCDGCVLPGVEKCNGLDDNCNGEVDEGFDLGKVCSNNLLGVCARNGTIVCRPDGTSACDAPTVQPGIEVCNGLDDDCDGTTDEPDTAGGNLPGEGGECGMSLGECRAGKLVCDRMTGSPTFGQFVCKDAMGEVKAETCDLKDNNCNGQTDEGLGGGMCVCLDAMDPQKHSTDPAALAALKGECKPGTLVCRGREPLDCLGCVLPRMEKCNLLDDDCDGETDEGDDICPPARVCIEGRCELKCAGGEFPCPSGYDCTKHPRSEYCKSSLCNNKSCAENLDCDPQTGNCEDRCAGVTCPSPKVCSHGDCLDCRRLGCPGGQLCIAGACIADKCAGVTCQAGEACDNGTCVSICPAGCPQGQYCSEGRCQVDPCAGIACAGTEVCDRNDGTCKPDRCRLSPCIGGVCVPVTGECKDNPCATYKCPQCNECRIDQNGVPRCSYDEDACGMPPPPPETKTIKVGGSGCACDLQGGDRSAPAGGLLLSVLAVTFGAFGLRRRRRYRP